MKVLITGGAGFIGSNLCKHLVEHNSFDEVRVIDDLSSGTRESIKGLDVTFHEGSILDDTALTKAAAGVDAIVHLAALGSVPRSIKTPLATHEVNATGTLRVLEAARPTNAHTILASSSSVYGANPTLPKIETLQLMPMSPYAVSKVATEQYAMAYAQCYDLPVLPFRFFNVFGPGQLPDHIYAAVIPIFVSAALRREPLPVNGDGRQSRDFTYVGTVVETITDALVRKVTGTPTNLAFGTRTTLTEFIALLGNHFDKPLDVTFQEPRIGDVQHSQAANSELQKAFPSITPVELPIGLEHTINWMKEHLRSSTNRSQIVH